ncbi:MAG: hypothetical protein NC248_04005 [Bacteroides sp.]|nr:hypothetical protein [Bacteroides sp.]MCM1389965.1 hypothetical protein [Bacteroides sp.]
MLILTRGLRHHGTARFYVIADVGLSISWQFEGVVVLVNTDITVRKTVLMRIRV